MGDKISCWDAQLFDISPFIPFYLHLALILWGPNSMLRRHCGLCSLRNRKINIVWGWGGEMLSRRSKIEFYCEVSQHFRASFAAHCRFSHVVAFWAWYLGVKPYLEAYLAQISTIKAAIYQVSHSETLGACASSRNIAPLSLGRRKWKIKNNSLQASLYLIEFPVCHVAVY